VRLHTDFRDYYDHAVGFGVDEKVHYNRLQVAKQIDLRTSTDLPRDERIGILGFCGTLYPFVCVERFDRTRDCDYDDEYDGKLVETFYAFDLAELSAYLNEWYGYVDGSYDHHRDIELKRFFLEWSRNADEIFLELKSPIWLAYLLKDSPNGIVNPSLKEIGFERLKDPFSAFQEISTYLANILIEQKPIVIIDDKYRIEQHGFDLKESFRNTKRRK
jgi:hypothetical protein